MLRRKGSPRKNIRLMPFLESGAGAERQVIHCLKFIELTCINFSTTLHLELPWEVVEFIRFELGRLHNTVSVSSWFI
jgi:hypothetical protein